MSIDRNIQMRKLQTFDFFVKECASVAPFMGLLTEAENLESC